MSESQGLHIIRESTEVGWDFLYLVVVEIERRKGYLLAERMYLLDIIVSQVERPRLVILLNDEELGNSSKLL